MTKIRKKELIAALNDGKTVTFTQTILDCFHMEKPKKVAKITKTRVVFEDGEYIVIAEIFPEEYFCIVKHTQE